MKKHLWLDLLVISLAVVTVLLLGIRKLKSFVNQSINDSLVGISEELSNLNSSMLVFEESILALKESRITEQVPVTSEVENAATVISGNTNNQKVNLNQASLSQLMDLPGIGQSYASRIIEGRPYSSVDDLARVKGIGVKTVEKLRSLVVVN